MLFHTKFFLHLYFLDNVSLMWDIARFLSLKYAHTHTHMCVCLCVHKHCNTSRRAHSHMLDRFVWVLRTEVNSRDCQLSGIQFAKPRSYHLLHSQCQVIYRWERPLVRCCQISSKIWSPLYQGTGYGCQGKQDPGSKVNPRSYLSLHIQQVFQILIYKTPCIA